MLSLNPPLHFEALSADPRATRRRARRVWLLLAALWIMNGFDLVFTLHAEHQGLLVEANPVALAILPHGPAAVIGFKIGLVGFSSWIMLQYRRRRLVESVMWLAVVAYVGVSFRWMHCYEIYHAIVTARHYPAMVPFGSV